MVNAKKAANTLNQEIARLSETKYENEIKLKRLRNTKSNIENDREELFYHQRELYKPEFTSSTWAGMHATKHLNILESAAQSYRQIANYQVEVVLDAIVLEIKQLESENYHLMSSIDMKRSEVTRLQNQ